MSATPPKYTLHALQRRSDNTQFAAIEADLMPAFTALKLDQRRCTYVGTKGDLICFLIEIDRGARKREPAMLICNKTNPKERNTYLVLSELWLLCDPDISGDPRQTRANRAEQQRALDAMTEQLYGFVMRDSCFRVLDAVFDFAQDLQQAKPPVWMTHAQWLQALAEDDMTFLYNGVAVNN